MTIEENWLIELAKVLSNRLRERESTSLSPAARILVFDVNAILAGVPGEFSTVRGEGNSSTTHQAPIVGLVSSSESTGRSSGT